MLDPSESSIFSRDSLLQLLRSFVSSANERVAVGNRIISFVEREAACAERSHQFGHLTGSAWVVNSARTQTLLLHHRKLNRWIQPGGHADGSFDLLAVALREAREESGLTRVEPVTCEIFDVDIHRIPPFKDIPAHYHFDVRFLLCADDTETPRRNEESNEVKWIDLADITKYTDEESVLRMARLGAVRS